MTVDRDQQTVQSALRSQKRWSQAANAMKKRLDRARIAVLVLSATGAIAAAANAAKLFDAEGWWPKTAAAVAAVSLALVAVLTAQQLNPTAIRRWARTRAVSEGIKTLIYKFRAGVPPFTDAGAAAKLSDAVLDLEDAASDLAAYVPDIVTSASDEIPGPLTHDDYIKMRLVEQIDEYYRPKARDYAVLARRLRIVESAFLIAAAVVAGMGALSENFAPWVTALTSLAGFLAAHHAARRYEFLVDSYTATANCLQRRIDRWRAAPEQGNWTQFVEDCEGLLAAENQSWVAKWADSGR